MKRFIYIATLLVFATGAVTAADFTVAQVLAHPDRFNGKRISVTGYYVAGNEESCLYPSAEARDHGQITQSIWVEFRGTSELGPVTHHYARFVGTFHHRHLKRPIDGYGQWGLSPSALLDVTSFRRVR